MPSKISRYSAGGWVEVTDLEGLDTRLDVLEATNVTNGTSGFISGNAEMGPRDAPWPTMARFGHAGLADNLSGYLAQPDGVLEINVPAGKYAFIQDQGGPQLAQFAAGKANIAGMGIGASPPHGSNYTSLWRNGDENPGNYGLLLASDGTYLNAPTNGSMYFRRGNSDIMTIGTDNKVVTAGVVSATGGNTNIGNHSVYFPSYGGGWYMGDSTWLRSMSDKGTWLGSGWYGCDGGITIGRGGVIDGTYKLDVNGNGHVWGVLYSSGTFYSENQVQSRFTKTDDLGWYTAQMVAWGNYGGGDTGHQTRISMHSPGSAPQIRVIGGFGELFMFVNGGASANVNCQANQFINTSTIRAKREVRSLHPDRDFFPIEPLDPDSDTIEEPPDIMALNVVTYRPKIGSLEIVPTDPSGDYDTVSDDPTTFEYVSRQGYMGDQSRREVLGLIAEEVQYIIPSAVFHGPDREPEGIFYDQVTVALLDHVQRLTNEVATLRYRITELERENDK